MWVSRTRIGLALGVVSSLASVTGTLIPWRLHCNPTHRGMSGVHDNEMKRTLARTSAHISETYIAWPNHQEGVSCC